VRELRQLREENSRLKGLVADLNARQTYHGRDHSKKRLKPARRRELVEWVQTAFGTGITRACRLVWISRSLNAYRSRRSGQEHLRIRMRELAQARPRYGYRRVHVLLRRDGWPVNMKRVRRLYRLEGRQLRYRLRRRKHASQHRGIPPAASAAHERWSMDFSMVRSACSRSCLLIMIKMVTTSRVYLFGLRDGRDFRARAIKGSRTRPSQLVAMASKCRKSSRVIGRDGLPCHHDHITSQRCWTGLTP
jgi:hypothetical protein